MFLNVPKTYFAKDGIFPFPLIMRVLGGIITESRKNAQTSSSVWLETPLQYFGEKPSAGTAAFVCTRGWSVSLALVIIFICAFHHSSPPQRILWFSQQARGCISHLLAVSLHGRLHGCRRYLQANEKKWESFYLYFRYSKCRLSQCGSTCVFNAYLGRADETRVELLLTFECKQQHKKTL